MALILSRVAIFDDYIQFNLIPLFYYVFIYTKPPKTIPVYPVFLKLGQSLAEQSGDPDGPGLPLSYRATWNREEVQEPIQSLLSRNVSTLAN